MIREHHLPVARTARYHTLGPTTGAPRELWIVCHGYGQLAARFLSHFELLDDGTRLIVAPEGLSRFYVEPANEGTHEQAKAGASWMTREDRLSEIDDYIRYLDALYAQVSQDVDCKSARIIALGFSQGVAAVCRWVERGQSRVDELVLWAGGVPPDMELDRPAHPLRTMHPIVVTGDADEFTPPDVIAAHEARLRARGVTYEHIRFTGGHRLDYDTLRALAARWR
jgi:predicted esterase